MLPDCRPAPLHMSFLQVSHSTWSPMCAARYSEQNCGVPHPRSKWFVSIASSNSLLEIMFLNFKFLTWIVQFVANLHFIRVSRQWWTLLRNKSNRIQFTLIFSIKHPKFQHCSSSAHFLVYSLARVTVLHVSSSSLIINWLAKMARSSHNNQCKEHFQFHRHNAMRKFDRLK